MAQRTEDYAIIGDCQTAALVGRDGSIDWLCFPNFDSRACFAALLGTPEHGRWRISPVGEVRKSSRRYRGETLILETDFETDEGAVTVIDFMPPRSSQADLIRLVVGRRGQVKMKTELVIRCDYGSIIPWVHRTEHGLSAIAGPDMLRMVTPAELHGEDFKTIGEFTVSEGDRIPFDLTWYPSHRPEPKELDPEQALNNTEEFWTEWISKCTEKGHYRDAVVRSLITLKALTFAPTGGIVAAATTSMPEHIGSIRNWDYRYCWLRDATFTLLALIFEGYQQEAHEWRQWLLRAVAGTPASLHIMYGLHGERRLPEMELPWLPGFENSKPVRIGNAAYDQFQLDVYGEVVDALYQCHRLGMDSFAESWDLIVTLMEHLQTTWREPDEGIWEVRGPRRHFTHSKMMAWVAFDRAVKAVEQLGQAGPVDRWRQTRDEIKDEILREGFDTELNAFVQFYGSKHLDASILMMPLVGFLPATDDRMQGTIAAIERELLNNGYVRRYAEIPEIDGLPPSDAAFLLCNFWLVDNYVLMGRRADAERLFDRMLSIRNDVGLLSECYDPKAGRLVGNFPQAFSHIGLIDSARNLSRETGPIDQRLQ
ncbi:glycoside hydrolase family 15 protein [soil metagenome]